MAGESNLSLSIFDYVLDLSLRSLPYQEKQNPKNKKETIRIATVQPVAVSLPRNTNSRNFLRYFVSCLF